MMVFLDFTGWRNKFQVYSLTCKVHFKDKNVF